MLGPRPKDGKKPSSQAEKDNYAAGLKRKAAEVLDEPSIAEQLRALLAKKRKVRQFSKGWVYVDSDMEAARQEEAALDKEIARLQREVKMDPNKASITMAVSKRKEKKGAKQVLVKFEEKVKTKITGPKPKQNDIPKEHKRSSMLGRLSGSLRRAQEEVQPSAKEKRKSASSFRQSTLSFQRLESNNKEDHESLLERPATSGSLRRTVNSARNSLLGRKGSMKGKSGIEEEASKSSTLRLVEQDD